MEQQPRLEIVMVSGSCCVPSLARTEADLEKRIGQAVDQLGLEALVRVVGLGDVLAGTAPLSQRQAQLIQALFQKYGARMAPAALIDERVLFAGGAPATDKLIGMLEAP